MLQAVNDCFVMSLRHVPVNQQMFQFTCGILAVVRQLAQSAILWTESIVNPQRHFSWRSGDAVVIDPSRSPPFGFRRALT